MGKAATHKAVGPGQAFTAEEVENASEFFKRLRIRLHDFLVENPQDPDAEVIYALAVKIAAAFPLNAKDGEVLEDPLTMEALTSDTPVFISSSGYIFDLEGAKTALDEIKKRGYLGLIGKPLPEIEITALGRFVAPAVTADSSGAAAAAPPPPVSGATEERLAIAAQSAQAAIDAFYAVILSTTQIPPDVEAIIQRFSAVAEHPESFDFRNRAKVMSDAGLLYAKYGTQVQAMNSAMTDLLRAIEEYRVAMTPSPSRPESPHVAGSIFSSPVAIPLMPVVKRELDALIRDVQKYKSDNDDDQPRRRGCERLLLHLNKVGAGTEDPQKAQRVVTVVLNDPKNDSGIFHSTFSSDLKALYARAESILIGISASSSAEPSRRR
ncbi:MAG: hypothetical protein A3F13_06990 [Gammaproteobacteria bacterium RIFCSPHIGHO2_12_FULL_40_19]|nr:MAG: hypothetical protein A3F13_06990 [Gammaproteobacteria bacterium RIFCSPHIGHO2_12_FULL_40_19]